MAYYNINSITKIPAAYYGTLVYHGISFDEEAIVSTLWESFLETHKEFSDSDAWINPAEEKFAEYMEDNLEDYLQDVYAGFPIAEYFSIYTAENVVEETSLDMGYLATLAEMKREDILWALEDYANNQYENELEIFGTLEDWLSYCDWYEEDASKWKVFDDAPCDMVIAYRKVKC